MFALIVFVSFIDYTPVKTSEKNVEYHYRKLTFILLLTFESVSYCFDIIYHLYFELFPCTLY